LVGANDAEETTEEIENIARDHTKDKEANIPSFARASFVSSAR
jgi:hypothetical protein